MIAQVLLALLLLLAPPEGSGHGWVLVRSTLTYHVSHKLHDTDGVSHAARGRGTCQAGQCDFLIAVPVKSFDSGDTNRDLHMLQVTLGGQFPMVTVRTRLPEEAQGSKTIRADLEIDFAGQTAKFTGVSFEQVTEDGERRIEGTIPASLAAFHIDPPLLFGIAVKDEMPVRVEMTWRREN